MMLPNDSTVTGVEDKAVPEECRYAQLTSLMELEFSSFNNRLSAGVTNDVSRSQGNVADELLGQAAGKGQSPANKESEKGDSTFTSGDIKTTRAVQDVSEISKVAASLKEASTGTMYANKKRADSSVAGWRRSLLSYSQAVPLLNEDSWCQSIVNVVRDQPSAK